jgi:hypothetical protein
MDNSSIGLCDMQPPVSALMIDCSTASSFHASTSLETLAPSGLHDSLMRIATSAYLYVLQHTSSVRTLSWLQIVTVLALCSITYLTSLIVYRLYLSPLAAFPGPFLARTTHWYEFYYTYVQTGMYYKKVAEFHAKYGKFDQYSQRCCQPLTTSTIGPVVRVTPDDIHVMDPSAYQNLFVTGVVRKTEAYPRFSSGTGFEGMCISIYNTEEITNGFQRHDRHVHEPRRSSTSPNAPRKALRTAQHLTDRASYHIAHGEALR